MEPPAELPRELRDSMRFGYLEVPQDHADPLGPRLRIALAMLPARAEGRLPDPVVSIAGGPGLPAIALHMRLRLQGGHPLDAFRHRRDLIVIDVRGHGFSEPARCRELHGAEPLAEPSVAAERLWLDKLAACSRRLRTDGVRLETLSSAQAAHDLELLRRALGAPALNLIGLSYGSRIAAEAVRQVPGSVRAVYFSGPVPAGRMGEHDSAGIADEVLGTLFRRCASHSQCAAAYPHLRTDYDSVLIRLRRRPERVSIPRSAAAPEGEIVVSEELMREGLTQLLLNRQLAAGAPLLIHTLAGRGLSALGPMTAQLIRAVGDDEVEPGTFLSFWCNDGVVNRSSPERLRQRCRTWLGDGWDGRRAEPVRAAVPALIETGELDPRTPPSFARFLAEGFEAAHVVVLPWFGHERPPECSFRISRAFFDAPHAVPDTTCLASIPPIDFVTGVVPSRWVGRATGTVAARPWLAALPGTAALLLLAPLVGVPIGMVRAGRRGRRDRYDIGSLAVVAVAAVGLILVIGFGAAAFTAMRTHFLVPLLGVQREWSWVLVVPWLLLVLTPAATLLALGGRARDLPLPLRRAGLLGASLLLVLWGWTAWI